MGFKLTAKDFKIEQMRGSGNGGQKKQKTSSAIRITHEPSGVSKFCQDHREMSRNKTQAFTKLTSDPRFKSWCERRLVEIETKQTLEQWIEKQMDEKNLKVELL